MATIEPQVQPITVSLTRTLLQAYQTFVMPKAVQMTLRKLVPVGSLLLVVWLFAPVNAAIALVGLGMIGMRFLAFLLLLFSVWDLRRRGTPGMRKHESYTFSEDSVQIASGISRTTLQWSAFQTFKESPDHFILEEGYPGAWHTIPKRGPIGAEDEVRLRSLLMRKVRDRAVVSPVAVNSEGDDRAIRVSYDYRLLETGRAFLYLNGLMPAKAKSWYGSAWLSLLAVSAVWLIYGVVIDVQQAKSPTARIMLALWPFAVTLLTMVTMVPLLAWWMRRKDPTAFLRETVTLNSRGVGTEKAFHNWESVTSIVETDRFFLFYIGNSSLFIPKRALNGQTNSTDVCSWLQEHATTKAKLAVRKL